MATFGLSGDAEMEGRDRLLLVDPYGTSREGLGAALRAGGFAVETAAGSSEAIHKVGAAEFDLAIIDLDLPPVHGIAETAGTWCASCAPRTRRSRWSSSPPNATPTRRRSGAVRRRTPARETHQPAGAATIVRNLRPETTPV